MFVFLDRWHDILPRDGGHVVSVFGGGGKTSLLEAACAALAADGVPVAVTTTTRTEALDWPDLRVLDRNELGTAPEGPLFIRDRVLPADGDAPEKWLGPEPADVDALAGPLPDHVLLVEADGSAGKPLTLHRDDEPRLPARTSLAVPVIGLSCIGRSVAEVLHRYGELPHDHIISDPEAPWDWDRTEALLRAYLDRIPAGVPVLPALLQMDECDDSIGLFEFAGRVMEDLGIPVVLMGDTSGPEPRLRTACRPDPEDGDGEA